MDVSSEENIEKGFKELELYLKNENKLLIGIGNQQKMKHNGKSTL